MALSQMAGFRLDLTPAMIAEYALARGTNLAV
jgi:hypothetical protein